MVEVLEGVKEDADAVPVILPAEDGALDVVRVSDEPDRQACAHAVPRLGLEARKGGAGAGGAPSPYRCIDVPLARSSRVALHSGAASGVRDATQPFCDWRSPVRRRKLRCTTAEPPTSNAVRSRIPV